MEYEINVFEDVFENKNLIQLRKVTRSRGKQSKFGELDLWLKENFMV